MPSTCHAACGTRATPLTRTRARTRTLTLTLTLARYEGDNLLDTEEDAVMMQWLGLGLGLG